MQTQPLKCLILIVILFLCIHIYFVCICVTMTTRIHTCTCMYLTKIGGRYHKFFMMAFLRCANSADFIGQNCYMYTVPSPWCSHGNHQLVTSLVVLCLPNFNSKQYILIVCYTLLTCGNIELLSERFAVYV